MIKTANSTNFKELVSSGLVLVDFYASWCGPCKMLSPIIEELSEERSNIEFVKANVDELNDIAREYGIMSIPTLILFENGSPKAIQNGFMPKELLSEWINENI